MNIDLIQKLIKLANNNPNDNEANLAARRVCKMLADHKFHEPRTVASKLEEHRQSQPKYPDNEGIWENIRRSREAEFKTRHYGTPVNDDFFKEFFKDFNFGGWTTPKYRDEEWRNANSKVKMKCSKCQQVKETSFRGPESIWVCMECRGKEYQDGR